MQVTRSIRTHGFSLVELSIVLVIIGLLVGGILAGKSLIHAAELRKIGTDITRYRTAAFAFRDKYFAMPGDMTNAQSFWPTTYNGVGNQHLNWNRQGINFWNHLQLAGLLEGNIDAVSSTVTQNIIGTHVPPCPLGACGYSMVYFGAWTYQPHLEGRNVLYMGIETPNNYTSGRISNLHPEDVWNLDTKYDDDKPDLGLILTASVCSTGTYPDRVYYLSQPDNSCYVMVDFFR